VARSDGVIAALVLVGVWTRGRINTSQLGAAPVSGGVVAACCADAEPAIVKIAAKAVYPRTDFLMEWGMWS